MPTHVAICSRGKAWSIMRYLRLVTDTVAAQKQSNIKSVLLCRFTFSMFGTSSGQ